VAAPRSLRALSLWTCGKEMEMIENRQYKADCSGVCLCEITSYDKQSEVPRKHSAATKLQKPLLI